MYVCAYVFIYVYIDGLANGYTCMEIHVYIYIYIDIIMQKGCFSFIAIIRMQQYFPNE